MILNDTRKIVGRLKINPSYAVSYCEDMERSYSRYRRPSINKAQGTLSVKSIARMRNAFSWMLLFADLKDVYSLEKDTWYKFRLNFCTVTLSTEQKHSDTYILHKMLFPLLKYLQRKHNVHNYVWRAEIQEQRYRLRGERCIHFHFVTDKFIHHRKLRNKWNALQLAHGYREPAQAPPSTEVKAVRNENKAGKYFSKYLSKKPKEKKSGECCTKDEFMLKVFCKQYGMSRNLSRMDCTLREEETPNFRNESYYHITQHCTPIRAEKQFTVFQNRISMEQKLGVEVARKFTQNYKLFHARNDGEVVYLLD